jgi:hypothetical protein
MRGSLYLGKVEVWADRRDSRMSWRAWSPYMVVVGSDEGMPSGYRGMPGVAS